MSPLLQVCSVVVTLAILSVAVASVRVLSHIVPMLKELRRLLPELRRTLVNVDALADELRDAIQPLRDVGPAARRVAFGFERIGERIAMAASSLLDQVEDPWFQGSRLLRGVRVGASQLVKQWADRLTAGRTSVQGGNHHE